MQLLSWPNRLRYGIYAAVLAVLFAAAFIPEVGEAAGPWHIRLHLTTFVIIGLVSCWAWPKLHWGWQTPLIAVIALAHEWCEVFGHGHHLEFNDVLIDTVGGVAGIILGALINRIR